MPGTENRTFKVLSHPALLLVLGGIISGLLIPYFTKQWQDYQKELELKTNIANEISKTTSDIISVTGTAANPRSFNNTNFGGAFVNWKESQAIISSKIKGYFSDAFITQKWENLSSGIERYLNLGSVLPSKYLTRSLLPRDNPYWNWTNTFVNSPLYNYDLAICGRIGSVLGLHNLYPQTNAINIDKTELDTYHCNKYYVSGLEDNLQIRRYFHATNNQSMMKWDQIVHNHAIDWHALVHVDDQNALKNAGASYANLRNYIQNDQEILLDTIFRTRMTLFK